ncbi:MAG TPA: DUF1398 domain-containing protein [Xanthobacteraceae bacterium]|nr:DUF1398 domain-containing protein [Xanthobacteraceae bacterium]
MDQRFETLAATCLKGAEDGTMSFPQIVATLMENGFESYLVDFRRASAVYYRPDGDSVALPAHPVATPIAAALDGAALAAAIGEAQRQVPGYSYRGFCEKSAAAGCAFYLVSFSGRRAVYFGRTGQSHVEPFPN